MPDIYERHQREPRVKGVEMPELSLELLAAFRGQMQRITLRTLLSEMELCEENGMLEGATEKERYEYFEERFLSDAEYLREIYEAYPAMYENVIQALENSIRNVDEMLDCFTEDRDEINSRFFRRNPAGQSGRSEAVAQTATGMDAEFLFWNWTMGRNWYISPGASQRTGLMKIF